MGFGLNIRDIAAAIDIPVDRWPGQCYGVACMMLRKDIVFGSPRYGHWLGPVSKDCIVESFKRGMFCRHGWIEDDDMIVDPTRWVFEAVEPYIYVGEAGDFYDAGGNVLREAMEKPYPDYSITASRAKLSVWKFCPKAHRFVMDELFDGAPGITNQMAFWLANLALPRLAEHAEPIYRALIDADLTEWIPIDNRRLILHENEL